MLVGNSAGKNKIKFAFGEAVGNLNGIWKEMYRKCTNINEFY